MKTEKFFVYGTLKVGGHFAKEFDNTRVKSMKAKVKGFDLFDLGYFPGIVPGEGTVYGELHEYKNPEKVTKAMDRIEGYNEGTDSGLYVRRKAWVEISKGKTVEANLYIFNNKLSSDSKKVDSGVW